jgi:hypothetical protein
MTRELPLAPWRIGDGLENAASPEYRRSLTPRRAPGDHARTPPPAFLFLQIQLSKSIRRRNIGRSLDRLFSRQRVSYRLPGWVPQVLSRERCPSRAAKHCVPRDKDRINTKLTALSTPTSRHRANFH